jgi:hypothetical protein
MLFNTTLINYDHVKKMYDTDFQSIDPYTLYSQDFKIPLIFDSRTVWKSFLSPIQNQKNCGSCYAFAWASALSDRLALLTNNEIHVTLTSVNITICPLTFPGMDLQISSFNQENIDRQNRLLIEKKEQELHSCSGNNLFDSARFIYYVGATTVECVPNTITSNTGKNLPSCENIEDRLNNLQFNGCYQSNKAQRDFRLLYLYTINIKNIETRELNIQYELFKFGPIVTGFLVFDDFYRYSHQLKKNKNLIYTHPNKNTNNLGGHSVVIMGWGESIQDGRLVKYWLIRNSWGPEWGDNGYFRIERWLDECMLEQNIVCGIPDLLNTQNLDLPQPVKPVDQNLRKTYIVDPYTFYSLSTIKAINEKKLIGELQPIFLRENLPVVDDTFIAGKIIDYTRMTKNIILLYIIICIIIFILNYRLQ